MRKTLASSRRAPTLRSLVAKWCITAIDNTASKLSSRNGSVKLSQSKTCAKKQNGYFELFVVLQKLFIVFQFFLFFFFTSLSSSFAIWVSLRHRSEPILNIDGLTFKYFPFPQPAIILKTINYVLYHVSKILLDKSS